MGYISLILDEFPKLRPIVGAIVIFAIVVGAIMVLSDQKVKKSIYTLCCQSSAFLYREHDARWNLLPRD